MNITYIINNDTANVTLFLTDGSIKRLNIPKTDKRYPFFIEVLNNPNVKDLTGNEILELISPLSKSVIDEKYGFVVKDGVYYYNDSPLPGVLISKLESISEAGVPIDPLVAFIKRVSKNPSSRAINELYDFLAVKELPITEDGFFLAYKGIDADGYSHTGNVNTIVEKGIVDDSGRIKNDIFGEEIRTDRNQVDDDRNRGCSYGLHVGSFNYAYGFASKMILVKVDPADVVSVPADCSYSKCRVCAYTPLAYIEKDKKSEIENPTANEIGIPVASIYDEKWNEYDSKKEEVEMVIEKFYDETEEDKISFTDIKNGLDKHYGEVSSLEISSILQDLDAWDFDIKSETVYFD